MRAKNRERSAAGLRQYDDVGPLQGKKCATVWKWDFDEYTKPWRGERCCAKQRGERPLRWEGQFYATTEKSRFSTLDIETILPKKYHEISGGNPEEKEKECRRPGIHANTEDLGGTRSFPRECLEWKSRLPAEQERMLERASRKANFMIEG